MSANRNVALTFDDGPNPPYTEQILDILKKEGIKATFFVCGANIKKHPEIIKRTVKEGHLVGNHTYYHKRISYLLNKVYEETVDTQKLIDKHDPDNKKLFRFPWGWELPWVKKLLVKNGYKIIPVGIFGDDWHSNTSAEKIKQKVLSQLRDEPIITLHDGAETRVGVNRMQTVLALPKIIAELRSRNFRFILPD